MQLAKLTESSALGALALLVSSAASASEDICRKLADFALTTPQSTTQFVELKNDWSNFSKYCGHNDYEPGKSFCTWLISNTSTEFMHANVNSVLSCISPENSAIGIPMVTPDYLTGKYTSYSAMHLSADYEVTIEYSIGIRGQLDSLKISVAKEDWE